MNFYWPLLSLETAKFLNIDEKIHGDKKVFSSIVKNCFQFLNLPFYSINLDTFEKAKTVIRGHFQQQPKKKWPKNWNIKIQSRCQSTEFKNIFNQFKLLKTFCNPLIEGHFFQEFSAFIIHSLLFHIFENLNISFSKISL